MAFNPLTQTFDTIADLRTRTATDGASVTTLGYYNKGDGGKGEYYYDSASTETDNGGTVIKPTSVSGAGRWKLVHNGSINAANFGVVTADPSEAAGIDNALAVSGIKTLVFNHPITKSYVVETVITVPSGVVLKFEDDNKLTFSGSGGILGGIINCDDRKQCFAGTLNVTNLENSIISAMWFGAKPDAVFLGPTPTDNLLPAQKAMAAAKVANKVYFPGSANTISYYYYFSSTLEINRAIELYGDGQTNTIFLFAADTLGLWTQVNNIYIHDLRVRGSHGAVSSAINSSTAHGVLVNSALTTIERVIASTFNGDGINVSGNVTLGTNANLVRVVDCSAYSNGRAGFFTDSGDANGGTFINCNAVTNARYGIWESSFLGNTYIGAHIATNVHGHNFNKTVVRYKAAVSHGGNRYRVLTASTNVEPGVAGDWATYWTLIGTGGVDATFQTWDNARAYAAPTVYWAIDDNTGIEPTVTANWATYWQAFSSGIFANEWTADTAFLGGGGTYVDNANNRSVFMSCYTELDQPKHRGSNSDIVFGGFTGANSAGYVDGVIAKNIGGLLASRFQLFAYQANMTPLALRKPSVGSNSYITMTDESGTGNMRIGGLATTGFQPYINLIPDGTTQNDSIIAANANDSGTGAAFIFRAQNYAGSGVLSVKPLFDLQNRTTSVLKIASDGFLTNSALAGTGNRILQCGATGIITAPSTTTSSVDVEVTDNTKGFIIKSPNGSRFRITVDDAGTLSTTAL